MLTEKTSSLGFWPSPRHLHKPGSRPLTDIEGLLFVLRGLWNPRNLLRVERERPVPETPMAGAAPNDVQRTRLALARRQLADIFTPTRPLSGRSLDLQDGLGGEPFFGREAERKRIMRALTEDRAHVVIYGERGRGKTSLANFAMAKAQTNGFSIANYVCSTGSNFDAIMRGLFHDLLRRLAGPQPAGRDIRADVAGLLPPNPLRPSDVLAAIGSLRRSRHIFVIDEFDRVEDEDTRTALADTIKQCSDRGAPISLMIIGVSDSAEQLLGSHPSIQRCVARISLPLLTRTDVEQIVAHGEKAGLEFPSSARSCIAELARGVPYVAQLLSLRAGQAALDHGRTRVCGYDLIAAIKAAAVEADPRVQILYDMITNLERDEAVLGVLRAAAAGVQDEFGRFRAGHYGPALQVAGVRADPVAWQRVLDSGAIRATRGSGPDLYTFGEAMLPHFVLQRMILSRLRTSWPM